MSDAGILSQVVIRPLRETDGLKELTLLLNRAYKQLADLGFRYLATHQDSETTKERIEKAKCLVAVIDKNGTDKIIGTICYYSPENASGCEWYDRNDVATYGQFGVEPEYQKYGIGGMLIDEIEKCAIQDGAKELAIDTAEGATHLINFYSKRGYRHVGYIKWGVTNYRSVLMSKKLK
ncbi:MAG TPA: GNAT family N-acetyltransferase [Ignavibacteria bacterium]|nr:GNAT family N-acetyltransferase [Ignavibacteria bacterium]